MRTKDFYRWAYPREHRIWEAMKARCTAPSCKNVGKYQEKGIKVCERWNSFDNFIEDMGPCPENYSIDRIDNDGNYEPLNCRWASHSTQCKNRGDFNIVYTYNGETLCLKDWARKLGIKYITFHMRRKRHPEMSFEELINYVDPQHELIEYEGKKYTRSEICKEFNIPKKLFYDRWHKKWPLKRILTTPSLTSRYDKRNNFTDREKESSKL